SHPILFIGFISERGGPANMFHEPLKTRPAFLINLRSELEATRPKGGANGAGANSNVQCKLYLKQTGPPARPYAIVV
ncbi:hypothetical protein GWI33_023222, partial [Rhynchophorus ferrugineus]